MASSLGWLRSTITSGTSGDITANIPSLSLNNVMVFEVVQADTAHPLIANPHLQGNVIADCVEGGDFWACAQNMLECELPKEERSVKDEEDPKPPRTSGEGVKVILPKKNMRS